MRKKASYPIRRFLGADRAAESKTMHTGIIPLWTISDVAAYMQVTPGVVRGFIYRRVIPHFKCGRLIRFRQMDIEKWYGEHQRGGQ